MMWWLVMTLVVTARGEHSNSSALACDPTSDSYPYVMDDLMGELNGTITSLDCSDKRPQRVTYITP